MSQSPSFIQPLVRPYTPQSPASRTVLSSEEAAAQGRSPASARRTVLLLDWPELQLPLLAELASASDVQLEKVPTRPDARLLTGTPECMKTLARSIPPRAPSYAALHTALDPRPAATALALPSGVMPLIGRARVMAILNVTPDSFFDGGRYTHQEAALRRAEQAAEEGADILDVGGESTRPGASPVSEEEELRRVIPVIELLSRRSSLPISVDTMRARVAEAAIAAGAVMVNDVSGLNADPSMGEVIGRSDAAVVLMHMRGSPRTMQQQTRYRSLMGEIYTELSLRAARAEAFGIQRARIIVDPGIGFAKEPEDNLVILKESGMLREIGCPVLIGASRKSFLERIFGWSAQDRLEGSVAAALMAVQGGAQLIRVHDVQSTVRALTVAHAVQTACVGEHGLP